MPLSDFLKYKTYIDVKEAFETAQYLDTKAEMDKNDKKNK